MGTKVLAEYIHNVVGEYAFPCVAVVEKVENNSLAQCAELNESDEKSGLVFSNVLIPTHFADTQVGIFTEMKVGTKVLLNFIKGDRKRAIIVAVFAENTPQVEKNKILLQANGQNLSDVLLDLFKEVVNQPFTTADGKPVTLQEPLKLMWVEKVRVELAKILAKS